MCRGAETDTEAKVSPNTGTLKTNLRYSGNWGHWNLRRKQTKKTMGRSRAQEPFLVTWFCCETSGAAGGGQEEGTETEAWERSHKPLGLPVIQMSSLQK